MTLKQQCQQLSKMEWERLALAFQNHSNQQPLVLIDYHLMRKWTRERFNCIMSLCLQK